MRCRLTFLEKNQNRIFYGVLWIAFLLLMFWAANLTRNTSEASGDVHIDCLKTEDDADCIVLWQDGAAVMIDTGEKGDFEHILMHLKDNGINSIDYMLLTHNDKDHIGSALDIVKSVEVKCVIESPNADENDNILKLNAYLDDNGIKIMYPTHNIRISAGEMSFNIYPPNKANYEDKNNYSIAALLRHGKVNCLFTGDTLKKRDEELLLIDWPSIDLYKVPYHGRACSKSDDLFEAVSPKYAVVTSDEADDVIVDSAAKTGATLLYTRKEDIRFLSDGEELKLINGTDNNE